MQSVFLLNPITPKAKTWIDENLQLESWQYMGKSPAIEHRYIGDIVDGMIEDGLCLDTDFSIS